MSNASKERLEFSNPEYHLRAVELYDTASEVMDQYDSFAASYKNYGSVAVNAMLLESEQGNFITLERRLKLPLPSDPYWAGVMPRIQKSVPDANRNVFLHEYVYRDDLVIDQVKYYEHKSRNVNDDKLVEDELELDDLIQLTEEIRTADPVRRLQLRSSRIYKAVDTFFNWV